MTKYRKALMASAVFAAFVSTAATAETFNIPAGSLDAALNAYAVQTGATLLVSNDAIKGIRSAGANGSLSQDQALTHLLSGTGFTVRHTQSGALAIVPDRSSESAPYIAPMQLAQAAPPRAAVETVTVTSSKLGGADVQSIPIAITALSQEQLTTTQTAGGPDLVKQVPNLTFSKTNFTGYNIQIRGIGTQAISVTTDPAVAVAMNDIPFIRNHFFEQEFFDLSQAEVLRGPQGTLYGRNATAGVVNLVTAKPSDQFEAMASGDVGNYKNRRFEGMVNLPLVDDRLDLRVAGEWTKRDGYTHNDLTGQQVDGRDLWSGRITLGMKPAENLHAYLVWEHFQEDDDRMRTAKQLCHYDPGPDEVGPIKVGFSIGTPDGRVTFVPGEYIATDRGARAVLSQGCSPASLYSPESFETPNGDSLPIVFGVQFGSFGFHGGPLMLGTDPYASATQSRDLRVIETAIKPVYQAKNDTVEFNLDYEITPVLTFTSQTGYNHDFLGSIEDFNRFASNPGVFFSSASQPNVGLPGDGETGVLFTPGGIMCDPQLGCSDRFVGADLSQEHAWQISQEFRLASSFQGPFNFSIGGNYLHYETLEDYYVFLNLLTLESRFQDDISAAVPEATANGLCYGVPMEMIIPSRKSGSYPLGDCPYTDPSPLVPGFDGQGHNYFRSENPYVLSSYAGFGEAYYQATPDLKFTAGVRWTSDHKHFLEIPSQTITIGWGYPVYASLDQSWNEWTGRAVVDWTPKLAFTDQTLVYGSFSRGYKAGGANPPQPNYFAGNLGQGATHPLTFAPEFINAYEVGTKNTLLDGAITINGDVFYYDYKGYQISQIVDRTAVNLNFNAHVKGAEIEANYQPVPGLKFSFSGGYEDARLSSGSRAVDLMDRTAGQPGWMVVKPNFLATSNCILPDYVVADLVGAGIANAANGNVIAGGSRISTLQYGACESAWNSHVDPSTVLGDTPPIGFDPADPAVIQQTNNGEGFYKNLNGNRLPNAPPFTISLASDYTLPITFEWASTLHVDYYWQDYSWTRVFNDNPYDRLRGYTNINLALILTSQNGWQVMGYVKNVFNVTDITGAFLNSDDTALTTNVFVTDPRLFGVRVTKNW
ncbi:MAG TPA: TonB-dependent receptor [Rhizomicrobium sp.]|nr:TonB-dependent receptor [Rhizomicrobium sp.]